MKFGGERGHGGSEQSGFEVRKAIIEFAKGGLVFGEDDAEQAGAKRRERVVAQCGGERIARVEADDEPRELGADGVVVKSAQERAKDVGVVIIDGGETRVEKRELRAGPRQARRAEQRRGGVRERTQPVQRAAVAGDTRLLEPALIPAPEHADDPARSARDVKILPAKSAPASAGREKFRAMDGRELAAAVVAMQTLDDFRQCRGIAARDLATAREFRQTPAEIHAGAQQFATVAIRRQSRPARGDGAQRGRVVRENDRRVEPRARVRVPRAQQPVAARDERSTADARRHAQVAEVAERLRSAVHECRAD